MNRDARFQIEGPPKYKAPLKMRLSSAIVEGPRAFYSGGGLQEMSVSTAVAKITGDLSVKEQISFNMTNAKKTTHFEAFWTPHGIQLPDLVAILKYRSSMQCSSLPCQSSFSVSGCISVVLYLHRLFSFL